MAAEMNVGEKLELTIEYLDPMGALITTPPPVDGPPSWSDTTPSTDSLVAAADGQSAVATSVAAGTDTVRAQLSIGGVSFSATLDLTVKGVAPQVGSIQIVAGTPTPV